MRFHPLASSSHGNAYVIEDGQTKLLIECGVSYKKLQILLGFQAADLSACLISHEHKDHAGCYKQLLKSGIPIYASQGTADALDSDLFEQLEHGIQTTIGTMDIIPFATFHDAAEPLGFLVRSQVDGDTLSFATDTVNLGYQFPDVNLVAIECNYEDEVLQLAEHIPEKVRHRIQNTHMSIQNTCKWLDQLDKTKVHTVYLMHLSDACSDEQTFQRRVQEVVGPKISVVICPKEEIRMAQSG